MMTPLIISVFVVGYLCIAFENVLKVNKAALALLMCVGCWVLFAVGGFVDHVELSHAIERNLGEAGTTLFFLMGAMTIVEIVDQHGGFNFVRDTIKCQSKRKLLWRMAFMTAILSAVLDNLTTSIVMIMILRKLVDSREDRLIYAAMVIISANSGGAFSPIGDVTTIMLWNGKMISALGVIMEIIIPSFVSFIVPCLILQYSLHGRHEVAKKYSDTATTEVTRSRRRIVFGIGVGGLCLVPVFHTVTNLPPFVGILCVLAILWVVTDVFYRDREEHDTMAKRVTNMLSRIDITTILFFLGILMAVGVLAEIGVLHDLGVWLDQSTKSISAMQHYVVTGAIGILSSIVDNVPLVAGAMKMYAISTPAEVALNPALADFAKDGIFWQLLAYCAGVGGSMLIIGSAAGVTVMGMEHITFGWYLRKVTFVAFVGYIAGLACYWLQNILLFHGHFAI